MKNTLKTLLAVVAIGVATSVSAVNIPDSGKVTIFNTPVDGGQTGGIYKGVVPGIGGFFTFCLEHGTRIVFNQELDYTLSNAVSSALGAPEDGDVISKATAYLFKEFTLGNLFDPTDGANEVKAGMLQLAIWYLEDETSAPDVDNLGANIYIDMILPMFGDDINLAKADDTEGEVKVMNLSSANNRDIQDVLVYHVSDSGTTLALLGLALSVFAIVRRRNA